MEVIYTGLRQTPEMIAEAALQEDVDVVGLSILSGAHNALVPAIIEKLHAIGLVDVKVFVGGIIPQTDYHHSLIKAFMLFTGQAQTARLLSKRFIKLSIIRVGNHAFH